MEQPVKLNYQWIPSTVHHDLPAKAVIGGQDADGSTIYIASTTYRGDQLVVKLVHSRRRAYVSYAGAEIAVTNFYVLVGDGFKWQSVAGDQMPVGAVSCGFLANMEPCYVGRAKHGNFMTPGKIHLSHRCLYLSFGGAEHRKDIFEVLVAPKKTSRLEWCATPFLRLVKLYRKI